MRDIPGNKVDVTNTITADEENSKVNELKNSVTTIGQSLSAADNFQLSKSLATYAGIGAYYADSGGVNTYVLSVVGGRQAPYAYLTGLEVVFFAQNANTGASTVNVAGLGVQSIKKEDGVSALAAGDIPVGTRTRLMYDGTNFRLIRRGTVTSATISLSQPRNLIVENNSGTPNSQLDISADEVEVSDGTVILNLQSVSETVDITVSGAGGLDTGTEASDTWYAVYVIYNPTSAGVSSLLSTSFTSPTLPSGYTFYRRVGEILNDSGGDFKEIRQNGNHFFYINKTGIDSVSINYGTSQNFVTLLVPPIPGIIAKVTARPSQPNNAANRAFLIRSSLESNSAPVGASAVPAISDNFDIHLLSGTNEDTANFDIPTDDGQIWFRGEEASDANSGFCINTRGWIDTSL